MVTLGEQMRSARVAAGYTQDDLAKHAFCSKTLIGNYERDEAVPDTFTAERIGEILPDLIDVFRRVCGTAAQKIKWICLGKNISHDDYSAILKTIEYDVMDISPAPSRIRTTYFLKLDGRIVSKVSFNKKTELWNIYEGVSK